MDWQHWKLGAIVAGLTGLLTAVAAWGVYPESTWKQLTLILLGSIAKDVLLFLRSNPVDSVKFEKTSVSPDGTISTSKTTVTQQPPENPAT